MSLSTYPGLIYPGEAYPGVAQYLFRTPMVQRPLTIDRPEYRPFNRVLGNVSLTVLKNGTAYTTVESPTDEQVEAATIAYLGGHDHVVTVTEADALTAAGYTVEAI